MEQTNTTPKPNITKDTNIAELVFRYPVAEEILLDYGLHCAGCIANGFDTLESGAKIHGLTDDEIAEMLERILEAIEFEE
ncbi:MAG: DUF1858 domain-containing protein [Patescibacteria group bacterium]|uniref:DUF1858 domain-containing protein n=1 Tax=candidate division WWE3 bacterium TaxID=2053526 RepID=A0A955EC50_UNCKA|nr:DUF1858 domain-containing protein [candidate division WWE3 bacterium]